MIRHPAANAEAPTLVIAHGLYGSGRNWGVIARRLSDRREVVAVDMRNHGDSPRFPVQGYPEMAADLAEVIDSLGAPVDYVSAIGVMFHIVDDAKWLVALKTLAAMLKPSGIMFIGGDFGAVTRNAQFHKTDTFESWRDYSKAEGAESEIRVNKRVRSLAAWQDAAHAAGLSIVDLVRTEAAPSISTPENDVLVLMRRDQA